MLEYLFKSICLEYPSGLQLYQKDIQHRCFPANIAKFLGTALLYNSPLVAASTHSFSAVFGRKVRQINMQFSEILKKISFPLRVLLKHFMQKV